MTKIFISAGDPSGDIHSAKLMNALRDIIPNIEFVGIGGDEMAKAGLRSIVPLSEISVIGFWEVAKKYSFFKNLLTECKSILKNEKIDAFIPVDYPGFNLRLAESAKSGGIPVIYYIAPQLWAWGKNRTKRIAENVDKLLVVFPFEEDFFRREGINAAFVGHPLLDIPEFNSTITEFNSRKKSIALLPGSRRQEIQKHLGIMIKASEILHSALPEYDIIIGKSRNIEQSIFSAYLSKHKYIKCSEDTRTLILNSRAGLIKSGTSNLESALAGLPFSLIYRTSALTYFLGKRLINTDYLSIINILAGKPVIKEFIQQDATPENLSADIIDLIHNSERYTNIQNQFSEIKRMLGSSGAARRAADEIAEYL